MSAASQSNPSPEIRWRTSIGHPYDERIIVRGHDVSTLMRSVSFASMVSLILRGELATEGEERVINAILVAVSEHGISPSATVSRYIAACGVPLQVAVAGGVLTFGDIHGGAGQEFARLLQEHLPFGAQDPDPHGVAVKIVDACQAAGQRVPGFGHPQHPSGDPRAPVLLGLAQETGTRGPYTDTMVAVGEVLSQRKGRVFDMNIDGIIAGLISDLRISWRHARTLLLCARSIGLAAHAVEEVEREPGWRHESLDAVEYDGPSFSG